MQSYQKQAHAGASILDAALAAIRCGVSIIPIDHQTKRPAAHLLPRDARTGKATWRPYQERIAGEDDVRRWCEAGIQSIAVVCGKASGGLLVLDFDAPGFYERWLDRIGGPIDGMTVQRTGGGGYQVLVRCPEPGGNLKLAWAVDEQETTGRTIAIETRGEGGYAVVAPSLHPSGRRYQWVSGDLSRIPSIDQGEADALLDAARSLDEAPRTRQDVEADAVRAHQAGRARRNGQVSVIDAFNAAHPIGAVLERHGYSRGTDGRYIRPGGKSESVSVKDGRSCHWSSNDPLSDGRGKGGCGCHDAFSIFAELDHGGDISAAVKSAADLLGMTAQRQDKAAAPVEPYRPFPLDALPEPVKNYAGELARATGNDPAWAALAALVTVAGVIGNRAAAVVKGGWTEPAILWGATVSRSGTMKSVVPKLATRPLIEQYKADRAAHHEAVAAFEAEKARYEVAYSQWQAATKKGIAPTDPPVEPAPPVERRLVVSDITTEKLGVMLQDNPMGLLLVRDELAAWVGAFDRYAAGGKGSDAPTWLSFFDGASAIIDRKSAAGTIFVERAAVSVLGSIQPGTLRRCFGERERESGLLARLLLIQPPVRPVAWTDDELSDATAKVWADLLQRLSQLRPGTDEQGNPRPMYIGLAGEAKAVFVAWHDRHGRDVADADADDLAAHLAKLKGCCIRFALLLACIDAVTGLDSIGRIERAHIERAIILTEWFKAEARRVYGGLAESEEDRTRRQLAEWIGCKGGDMSARELVQASRAYRTVADAEAALNALVEHGYGVWYMPQQQGRGGPRARRFRLPESVNVYSNATGATENGNSVDVDTVDTPETENSDGEGWVEV